MNLLKEAAKFIGWLSGSVAGIVALLTACGYFITMANLHVLGLDLLFIDYSAEFYIRRGGHFFLFAALVLLEKVFLPLLTIIVPAVSAVFLVFLAVRRRSWFQHLRSRFVGTQKKAGTWTTACKVFVYILLVVLFVYQLAGRLDLFVTPLSISGVLYSEDMTGGSQEERLMKEWIVKGETSKLRMHFSDVLISVILAGALLPVAWWATSGFRLRALLIAPFVIMFLVYLLLFPRVYGVLILPCEFAPVVISTKDEIPAGRGSPLYLINKGGDDFVLWNAKERKLLWIAKDEVRTVEIGRSRSILREPDRNSEKTGK